MKFTFILIFLLSINTYAFYQDGCNFSAKLFTCTKLTPFQLCQKFKKAKTKKSDLLLNLTDYIAKLTKNKQYQEHVKTTLYLLPNKSHLNSIAQKNNCKLNEDKIKTKLLPIKDQEKFIKNVLLKNSIQDFIPRPCDMMKIFKLDRKKLLDSGFVFNPKINCKKRQIPWNAYIKHFKKIINKRLLKVAKIASNLNKPDTHQPPRSLPKKKINATKRTTPEKPKPQKVIAPAKNCDKKSLKSAPKKSKSKVIKKVLESNIDQLEKRYKVLSGKLNTKKDKNEHLEIYCALKAHYQKNKLLIKLMDLFGTVPDGSIYKCK